MNELNFVRILASRLLCSSLYDIDSYNHPETTTLHNPGLGLNSVAKNRILDITSFYLRGLTPSSSISIHQFIFVDYHHNSWLNIQAAEYQHRHATGELY